MESPSEPESVARREMVQRLFVQHVNEIRGYARVICPDLAILDDLVQDVFVAMMSRADDFVAERNFKSWAYGFVRNKAMKAAVRRKCDGRLLGNEVLELLTESAPNLDMQTVELEVLGQCVEQLAPAARAVVRQRYENGLQPQQVAAIMGWTPGSVRVALARARVFLRSCVESRLATGTASGNR